MRDIVKMTLAEQIYTILREDIISQRIKCGEKLTLKSLQERFDISSTPIREAIKRLSQEGLIDHITNIGGKVVDISEKDIIEIYDFCSILDVAALKLALSSDKEDELIRHLRECIEQQEASLKQGNIEDFKLHSDDFHDILYKYADNSKLYDASLRIRSLFSILTNRYQNFINAETVVFKEHKSIYEAIRDKAYDKAIALMENHFEHAKNYLIENIRNSHN
ncbi:MAG: GntR family transcriptional regulator [Clostridia bacterium]|jgi:DNA-binding GntR family transcriptional regulator|nr:GntR family transcriptional regulator [Clostridia bacterium]